MTFDELKSKAATLPLSPGVYIMRDIDNRVIYVGKAKKLRNRVSQYFLDTVSHSPKTRMMVSKIHQFDVIVASNEFEALILECAQIKRYQPKYNILLKDDKGFPYIRLNMNDSFPQLSLVSKIEKDNAEYYGPYGSRGVTQKLITTLHQTLKLPVCGKVFPRDLTKGRHCLHYHMGNCLGWCQQENCQEAYCKRIHQLRQLLKGNFRQVEDTLTTEMNAAAEALHFELAAAIRDQLRALQTMDRKQFVSVNHYADTDAIGFGQTETKACFAVLHFSGGELVDKEYEILSTDDPQTAVSALLKQYYLSRGVAPSTILLPFAVDDAKLFQEVLFQQFGCKTNIKVPQKGDNLRLVTMACNNASQEAERLTDKDDRRYATLDLLANMLGISRPGRIESFDISNISGSDNVAAMVVFQDGKPCKNQYRHFKVDLNGTPDDYESMRQVLSRRLAKYLEASSGFDSKPDLWLIDGGIAHTQVALQILETYQMHIPVFGMVKDDRHRTRALVRADGSEIQIDNNQSVFALIGAIQEETHRFAIQYHRKLRSKRLRYSELDSIEGIGPKRKQDLLKHFSSLQAIKNASLTELEHYLPKNAAMAVYQFYHTQEG